MATRRTGIELNFFPARFDRDEVAVFSGRWTDTEARDALLAANDGLRAWRDGDRLYCWHLENKGEPPEGFNLVTVSLSEVPALFKRMVLDALARRMTDLGFTERRGWWVNFDANNLLAEVPGLAGAANDQIGLYAKLATDVYFTKNAAGHLVFGLIVDVLYTTHIGLTLEEWVAAGLGEQLVGTYVVLDERAPEASTHPELVGKSIGRVSGVRASTCVLDDLREPALAEVPLSSVRPEPARENLNAYLSKRFESAFERGANELAETLRSFVRAKKRHHHARGFVLKRLTQPREGSTSGALTLPGGIVVSFGTMVTCNAQTFPLRNLRGPVFSFDRAGDDHDTRIDRGLRTHGPYDRHVMSSVDHRLLVLAPRRLQGEVQLAVAKLLNGIKLGSRAQVFSGMKEMYEQPRLQAKIEFIDDDAMEHYAAGYTKALGQTSERPGRPKYDLVIPVISQAHRLLPDSENPYFQTKALTLVSEGVPTQAVTIEKLRSRDYDLQYILNTVAVAIYAKLGGTSHVLKLPDEPHAPTELVFGIGRSVIRHERFGERWNTVGFATVFRANGEYLYNASTPYCDDDNYEKAFENTIRSAVEAVAGFEQLPDGAPLRLIFHVPRRPGRHEERAILNAVGKLPKYDIEFALLHINDDHRFQLFDVGNPNPTTRNGDPKPTAGLLPKRGQVVELGARERLVTFIGPTEYRGYGTPAPLKVTLDRRSTFEGLDYMVQQLYELSFMRASSLTPGVLPATVHYAEALAHLAGRLRGVQQWTVELIQQRLGRKLWFV